MRIAVPIALTFALMFLFQQASAQLSEEGFRSEIERLDSICAKLKLTAERELMATWLPSDQTDAHLLFLPIGTDPLDVPEASPTAAAHGNGSSISAPRERNMRSTGTTKQGSSLVLAMSGPRIAVCGGPPARIVPIPRPNVCSARY